MEYSAKDHTFSVCAYGDSPYIEECIRSLLDQELKTRVIVCTSTPSDYLEKICDKCGVKLCVNSDAVGSSNIARDWNYAINCAETLLVTIAHQDDIYKTAYTKEVINHLNRMSNPLIAFTDYAELRDGRETGDLKNLKIKRFMLTPFKDRRLAGSVFVRRRVLSMGNPICCPSVTYVRPALPKVIFEPGFRSNIDWQAWEVFSRLRGQFVYVNSIQMLHRIHVESETSKTIGDSERCVEDYNMFRKFWPAPVAKILERYYIKGEDQNRL